MPARISVIIPTYSRPDSVDRFIDSLNAQTVTPKELIIVDGKPDHPEERYRQRLRPDITLVYARSTPSLTHQRNVGLEHASQPLVAYFDDDIVLEPEFLSAIIDTFDRPENSDVAAVYGNITNANIETKSAIGNLHRRGNVWLSRIFGLPHVGDGVFQPSGFPTTIARQPQAVATEYMPGGLTVYRTDIIKRFGFDEHLTSYSYMEDDDVAYRLSRQHRIMYCPAARCQHLHASSGRISSRMAGKMLIINHHYLWRKNFPYTLRHRWAHLWSFIGYPLLQMWNLQFAKGFGAVQGLWSVSWRRDPLSKLDL